MKWSLGSERPILTAEEIAAISAHFTQTLQASRLEKRCSGHVLGEPQPTAKGSEARCDV
jgi:hypothetical protein